MTAPTIPISTDSFEESFGDTIDIGVDVIHPMPITLVVFPAATVVTTLAQHGERANWAETEEITLRSRVRSLKIVETWLHGLVKVEREARARIKRQLGLVQEELESLKHSRFP
ncbi:hypothetical protein Tco_0910999 [Tanacetum coccineum]|uniref:Uncharacterized protein n=1 Tax=Tanacetum coccineum TaxID=301880 RepID=A0ABQ5CVF0_9ASTR